MEQDDIATVHISDTDWAKKYNMILYLVESAKETEEGISVSAHSNYYNSAFGGNNNEKLKQRVMEGVEGHLGLKEKGYKEAETEDKLLVLGNFDSELARAREDTGADSVEMIR